MPRRPASLQAASGARSRVVAAATFLCLTGPVGLRPSACPRLAFSALNVPTAAVPQKLTKRQGSSLPSAGPSQAPEEPDSLSQVPEWFRGNHVSRLVFAKREGIGCRQDTVLRADAAGNAESQKVLFSIYDIGQVLPKSWHEKFGDVSDRAVDGLWHSSLKAFGHTYDNPRHVDGTLPRVLGPDMRYQYELDSTRSAQEFDEYFKMISATGEYDMDRYDVRFNNCNHFIVNCMKYLVGPENESHILDSQEFLIPVDFAKQGGPPEGLGAEFNAAVLKGMSARLREQRRSQKIAQKQHSSSSLAFVMIPTVLFLAYLLISPHLQ